MISVRVPVQVQFYDVDSMQIVWHGHYARYLEEARCALLEKLDYSYPRMAELGHIWPITEMKTKFVKSLQFRQHIEVEATLIEYENRIRIDYRIFDKDSGTLLTKAQTTQLCVDIATGELRLDAPPEFLARVRSLL